MYNVPLERIMERLDAKLEAVWTELAPAVRVALEKQRIEPIDGFLASLKATLEHDINEEYEMAVAAELAAEHQNTG